MADRNQAARGPQKGSFNLRSKLGSFEWGGMMPDTDNASLPMNRLSYLVNGRFRGGAVIPRGGQTKLTGPLQAANAKVDGLFDFQVGTRRSLYVFGDGCPGISSSVGFNLGWYDFEQSPRYQPGLYFGTLTFALHGAVFGSDLYLGENNNLRKLKLIEAPYGVSALAISGSSQDQTVVTLTGYTNIPTLLAHDGRLLIAAANGAASAVFSWDGVTKRDDLTGINPPTGMALWRDKVALGYGGAPNHIRVRSSGSSPGAWATVNPAAGAVVFKEGVSYRDVLYFTSGGADIWSYDGTTLQVAHTIAGAITFGIANFDGFLFVAYTTAAPRARIARFDGTTWVDVHKDLTTQDAAITAARPLIDYRGELWVGVLKTAVGYLYHSVGTATSGTWTQQPLDQAAFNGDIQQLVVF